MLIKFDKMQALGNDFVMMNANQFSPGAIQLNRDFISAVCSRNYGIGCDTAVFYELQNEEIFARFFNPDGSEAEICGNAAGCLGLLIKKRNGISQFTLRTEKKAYFVQTTDSEISVNMGKPSFDPEEIGLIDSDSTSILEKLCLPDDLGIYHASCVSVGNPHLVLFCKNILDEEKIKSLGASLENYYLFGNRINVSFAFIRDNNKIMLTVFERGAGLTLACGSGACATAAVARVNRLVSSKEIFVEQKGGMLKIFTDDDMNIFRIGPAFLVFSGETDL
jgi:diaminopimelate epimerase